MEVCQFVLLEGVGQWGRDHLYRHTANLRNRLPNSTVCRGLQLNLRLTNGTI
jgi:hypothetical protein